MLHCCRVWLAEQYHACKTAIAYSPVWLADQYHACKTAIAYSPVWLADQYHACKTAIAYSPVCFKLFGSLGSHQPCLKSRVWPTWSSCNIQYSIYNNIHMSDSVLATCSSSLSTLLHPAHPCRPPSSIITSQSDLHRRLKTGRLGGSSALLMYC